jgi:hypothetical protein
MRQRPRRPSPEYSRMFTAFAVGGYLLVTGAIGFDVSHLHGWFRGGSWVDGRVWWQIALGCVLLLVGMFLSRRLAGGRVTIVRAPRDRIINVGSGRTSGAAGDDAHHALESRQSHS